jgi:precorrin-6A/cobalt-precorrin-6A reductase
MILLIGGTGETAFLAEALLSAGFRVLVSTATDMPLGLIDHPDLLRRWGELDRDSLRTLIQESGIRAIVDASHPYAAAITELAKEMADESRIPYFRWNRPASLSDTEKIIWADDHEAAARAAFSYGVPVLLTTGSRNLHPYATESRRTGIKLVVRVLNHTDSLDACRKAGIPEENVIAGKGPFSVEENLRAIRMFDVGVLVTKDSGAIGGVPEKLEAARRENCRVIVVKRPESESLEAFDDADELIKAIHFRLGTYSG